MNPNPFVPDTEGETRMLSTDPQLHPLDTKLLSKTIHTCAHDIRSPLSVLKPYLDFLKQVKNEERRSSILQDMKEATLRIEQLVNSLVAYTDLLFEAPKEKETIHLASLTEEVLAYLNPVITSTEAQIELHIQGVEHLTYTKAYLKEIITQLLQNALSHRHEDRLVHIRFSAQYFEQSVVLTIEDDGPGFSPHLDPQMIYSPFSTHRKDNHTGIGLAIVKVCLDKHGDLIKYKTSPEGTTFQVVLNAKG